MIITDVGEGSEVQATTETRECVFEVYHNVDRINMGSSVTATTTRITVSVPPHLKETLIHLKECEEDIPAPLHKTLHDFLNSVWATENDGASTPEIEYDMLHQISRWAQSEGGKSSLHSRGLGMHTFHRGCRHHQSLKAKAIQTPPTISSSHYYQG